MPKTALCPFPKGTRIGETIHSPVAPQEETLTQLEEPKSNAPLRKAALSNDRPFERSPLQSGDVFLHASALAGIGITTLQPGETLEFRVTSQQRGPQMIEVISVDSSTAVRRRPSRRSCGSQ